MPLSDEQIKQTYAKFAHEHESNPDTDICAFAHEIERLATEAERERCKAIFADDEFVDRSILESEPNGIGQTTFYISNDSPLMLKLFPKEKSNA